MKALINVHIVGFFFQIWINVRLIFKENLLGSHWLKNEIKHSRCSTNKKSSDNKDYIIFIIMLCTETCLREEKQLLRHLLLEKLVAHGVEGNGQPAAEEEDGVDGQLVVVVYGQGEVVPRRRQAVVIVLPGDSGGESTD